MSMPQLHRRVKGDQRGFHRFDRRYQRAALTVKYRPRALAARIGRRCHARDALAALLQWHLGLTKRADALGDDMPLDILGDSVEGVVQHDQLLAL